MPPWHLAAFPRGFHQRAEPLQADPKNARNERNGSSSLPEPMDVNNTSLRRGASSKRDARLVSSTIRQKQADENDGRLGSDRKFHAAGEDEPRAAAVHLHVRVPAIGAPAEIRTISHRAHPRRERCAHDQADDRPRQGLRAGLGRTAIAGSRTSLLHSEAAPSIDGAILPQHEEPC